MLYSGRSSVGQHEGQAVADVLEIFLRHEDLGETRLRREHHVLDAMALVVEHDVEDFVILAIDRVAVEGLHFYVLAVGVLVARLGEFRFLGGKALDNVFRRGAGGRSVLERTFLGARGQSRQSAGQHGQTNEQTSGYGFHRYSLANFGRGAAERYPTPRGEAWQFEADTAATPPPTPLRSVRPEGRVLQFCHSFGCLLEKEVG